MKQTAALLVGSISSLFAADAFALDLRIGGEFGLYHNSAGSSGVTVLTEVIDADISLESFAVVAQLPFTQLIGTSPADDQTLFRIGNPSVLLYYQIQGDVLTARIGAGFGLPAAQLPNNGGDLFTVFGVYAAAWGMNGLLQPWLWVPEHIPLMVPSLRLSADISLVSIEVGSDVTVLIPIDDNFDDGVDVIIPSYAGALIDLGFIGFGLRLGGVLTPTANEGADKFQLSLAPRILATLGPVELEARLVMNLDEPLGFAFDDSGVFGFFLGVHGVF
jgi:hypothetical protein